MKHMDRKNLGRNKLAAYKKLIVLSPMDGYFMEQLQIFLSGQSNLDLGHGTLDQFDIPADEMGD